MNLKKISEIVKFTPQQNDSIMGGNMKHNNEIYKTLLCVSYLTLSELFLEDEFSL